MKTLCTFAAAALLVATLSAGAAPAPAEEPTELVGRALALDGDTVWLEGTGRVRLWGISAPEMRDWPQGAHARAALDSLMGEDARLACLQIDKDRHGRPVAVCQDPEGDIGDLGEAMLIEGWAVVYRIFTVKAPEQLAKTAQRYDAAEASARVLRKGVWASWRGTAVSADDARN